MNTLKLSDVTIIIPIYCNTPDSIVWLDECLKSANEQGCPIKVWDDGSELANQVKDVIKHYRHIDYRGSNTNHGVSYARNMSVDQCSTKLIFPLDCDDRLKPRAIEALLAAWKGVPLYPDVAKFGDKDDPHYRLLDFHCDHIYNHVGFTSVNVLHSVEQHYYIHQWPEGLEFYEDGYYNALLFSQYCGEHYPEPLVEYRQHGGQRTVVYKTEASTYAKRIMTLIRRLDMACKSCGGAKKVNTALQTHVAPSNADPNTMPGEENGRVLALYVGGQGRGKHYYNGVSTKFPYRVQYGDLVYADPTDVKQPDDQFSSSLLIRQKGKAKEPTKPTSVKPAVNRQARIADVPKEPVVDKTPVDLPDITNMSVRQIQAMDVDAVVAKALLDIEVRGKNRGKAVQALRAKMR